MTPARTQKAFTRPEKCCMVICILYFERTARQTHEYLWRTRKSDDLRRVARPGDRRRARRCPGRRGHRHGRRAHPDAPARPRLVRPDDPPLRDGRSARDERHPQRRDDRRADLGHLPQQGSGQCGLPPGDPAPEPRGLRRDRALRRPRRPARRRPVQRPAHGLPRVRRSSLPADPRAPRHHDHGQRRARRPGDGQGAEL